MLWLPYPALWAFTAAIAGSPGARASHVGRFARGLGDQDPTPTEDGEVTAVNRLMPRATPSDEAPVCNEDKISIEPFCLPEDGQEVYVDEKYYVTWEPDAFPANSTVVVGLSYQNDTDGKSPYVSDKMFSSFGVASIEMEESWLQEEETNNLTVFIMDDGAGSGDKSQLQTGPMVTLTYKPAKHYPPPPHTSFNKLGLIIGLPIGLGVFCLILFGLCLGMRKKRSIGLGNIMGLKNKSHSVGGPSRIERLGGRGSRRQARSGAAIRLANMEEGERYADDPQSGVRSDTERFNEVERTQGNAFRQEISGMKSWR